MFITDKSDDTEMLSHVKFGLVSTEEESTSSDAHDREDTIDQM